MDIVLATTNKHKIEEIKHMLSGVNVDILSMLDLDRVPKVREDGRTFKENAVKKAKAFSRRYGLIALADDSGLEVKALHGAPGIRSARYAGPHSTKERLCAKVLRLLRNVPASKRGARFVCCIAISLPSSRVHVIEGSVNGRINFEMKGEKGFGYDPIFVPGGYKMTFAEMKPSLKNRLSHRGKALKKAKRVIEKLI
jgi:XTP/dITP diphosphohydrolase